MDLVPCLINKLCLSSVANLGDLENEMKEMSLKPLKKKIECQSCQVGNSGKAKGVVTHIHAIDGTAVTNPAMD